MPGQSHVLHAPWSRPLIGDQALVDRNRSMGSDGRHSLNESTSYRPLLPVEDLRRCLADLHPGAGGPGGLLAEARALVWPQREALLDMLERVQALGDTARSRPRERVLCHGDLIGDNLLGDRGGRLWVVDWDGAALAPGELDLALFTGQGFERFLDDYEGDDGAHGLDPDLVAFFLLRRNLDDLVDWLGALLANDRPERQRRGDLDGVRWCLSRWDALEARIEHTGLVLARRQRRHRGR